jgi:hypothetical protein
LNGLQGQRLLEAATVVFASGAFHARRRFLASFVAPRPEALTAWQRFLPGFALLGTAARSISPCNAAMYQMCAQLPLWAKFAHVQIFLPPFGP